MNTRNQGWSLLLFSNNTKQIASHHVHCQNLRIHFRIFTFDFEEIQIFGKNEKSTESVLGYELFSPSRADFATQAKRTKRTTKRQTTTPMIPHSTPPP